MLSDLVSVVGVQ